MAKKNSNPTHSSTTRTVLIIVLVALVLGLVLVGAKIAMDKQQLATQSDGTIAGTKALTGYSEPATYETGKGLWLKGGKLLNDEQITAEAKAGTPVFEYYFDYTCNVCNDYDQFLGTQMNDLVEGGKAVVVMRPTLTHDLPMAHMANNLLFWTAQNHPDKLWKLQKILADYTLNTYKSSDYEANRNNEKWQSEAKDPAPVLTRLAKEAGIDYSQVPEASTDSGRVSINILAQTRGPQQFGTNGSAGTPTYIANGKLLDVSGARKDKNFLEQAVVG